MTVAEEQAQYQPKYMYNDRMVRFFEELAVKYEFVDIYDVYRLADELRETFGCLEKDSELLHILREEIKTLSLKRIADDYLEQDEGLGFFLN